MKQLRWGATAVALVLVAGAAADDKKDKNKLPDAVVKALEKAETVDVYSLGGETDQKAGWHGAKVLGKAAVKGETELKALAGALKKGVDEGDRGARCFIPRHGLRAAYDGKTYDLVICFECGWVYIYTDASDKPRVLMISETPHKALDKILTDAKVPLAKPK
jgi:hypothetical protein